MTLHGGYLVFGVWANQGLIHGHEKPRTHFRVCCATPRVCVDQAGHLACVFRVTSRVCLGTTRVCVDHARCCGTPRVCVDQVTGYPQPASNQPVDDAAGWLVFGVSSSAPTMQSY